jgi:site-specific recombinase XerD
VKEERPMDMDNEFIDFYKFEKRLARKEAKIAQDETLSERNRELILSYIRASKLGKAVRTGQKRKIGPGRNLEAMAKLYKMCHWFKKDLDKVTDADMEQVILDLEGGRILSDRGAPYASETKSNLKKFIKKFYKWLLGENRYYPELVEWIDTSREQARVEAAPDLKSGVETIVSLIPDLRRQALVWVLFDSGFRTGEILNCQIRDIECDNGDYFLTCRYSKTKPRTVSLPYSSELLDKWLKIHPEKHNQNASLFLISRVMLYKTVKLYGLKAHKRNITPHMIRHTSATHYAPLLDRATFCKRFGWSYNSSMPDRYIDFAKLTEKKVVEVVRAARTNQIQEQLHTYHLENTDLKEQVRDIRGQLQQQNEFLMKLFSAMKEAGMAKEVSSVIRNRELHNNLLQLQQS